MAVTEQTRTSLIGLSVVMLGSAPGTDLLNEWVGAINDGMSLEDVANHIAASDAFQTTYPTFLTNREFAESFLNTLMGSEDVSDALVAAAADIVVGLLNDGMTRGALALAVVGALYDIHMQGMDHPAYGDLGMVAMAFANKIDVAEYYTVDLRQASSNSRVLRDVSSEMGLEEIRDSISDHLDPPDPIYLTKSRDNIEGTVANDLIVAEPDSNGEDTLDPFDTIDGGGGTDTLEVYAGLDGISIDKNHADVMSVEHVYLSSRAGISADLTGWEGVESVELGRFGSGSDVSLTVAGADVSTTRTFGGDVTISGAAGEVDITAGGTSAVTVNSGAHTTSVMVKGGASVNVNSAASASETVTSVSVDGVQRNNGADGARGDNTDVMPVTIADGNGTGTSTTVYVTVAADGTKTEVDEAAGDFEQNYFKAAVQNANGETADTGLDADEVIVTQDKTMAEGYDAEGADKPSVEIYSEAIEAVSLSNNEAIVLVNNGSDDAEDLAVTVSGFGSHTRTAGPAKLCLQGDGAAENVSLMVAGDSDFYLAGDSIKNVSVAGDGDVELRVTMFDTTAPSGMESLSLSGSGDVEISVADMSDLEMIDASASSGKNTITGVGGSVESVSGGSGTDIVHVMAHADDGLAADLGDGNDVFISRAGNTKSRVDGGAGMDILRLTSAEGQTHTPTGGRPTSNYTNFEVLDVGGSVAATYNAALIGVSSVIVSESTADSDSITDGLQASVVTLSGMGDGTGISVHGKGTDDTMASIVHMMPDRDPGSARFSGELDLDLTANGPGQVMLTLNVDSEIEVLNVDSSANPGGSSPSAGNSLTLLTGATVEAINVSGNAKLTLAETTADTEFALLELVDAEDNTGGVTITLDSNHNEDTDMLGGSGGDSFTGGGGDDTMHGNGGNDMLDGAGGADTIRGGAGMDMITGGAGGTVGTGDDAVTDRNIFQYTEASESSLSFSATGAMQGFDTIIDWNAAENNVISLGPTLFNSLQGSIKTAADDSGGTGFAVNDGDTDDAGAPNTVRALIGDGDGFFETGGGLGNTPVVKHSIAIVSEDLEAVAAVEDDPNTPEDETVAARDAFNRTWIFIDVDGDGDYTAGTDMAIALTGDHTINSSDFGA